MAYFARLIIGLFCCCAFPAFAVVTYTVTWAGFSASAASVSQAASSVAAQYTAANYPVCVSASGQTLSTDSARVLSITGLTVVFERYVTPTDSCNTPLRQNTVTASQSGAADPVQCPAGQSRDSETNTCGCDSGYSAGGQMVTGDVETGCFGGCTIRLRTGWYDKTANKTWGYDWLQNGNKCTASDVPVTASSDPAAQAASKCAVGQCPGTVNGQAVCVACTTQTTKQTEGTKTSSTEVSTSASGATSSQSTTSSSSSSTKCAGGSCTTTTTTTTTNPDGSKKDTTSAKTEPKTDFCESNPKSTLCTSGTWGGTCGSFSCDGDAVTCAIAQASWKSACAIDIDASDTKVQSGNAALSAGDRPAGHPANSPTSNVFTANLDQSNPYGSTCPADIPLNVLGNVVLIPLSSACDTFKLMGQVAVAFTLLAAAFVMFGGVKG